MTNDSSHCYRESSKHILIVVLAYVCDFCLLFWLLELVGEFHWCSLHCKVPTRERLYKAMSSRCEFYIFNLLLPHSPNILRVKNFLLSQISLFNNFLQTQNIS